MLEPDARVVLLDQLRPPRDYRLLSAVATTFTLDLTTALVPPLAFASFELRDSPDPVAALEAVRSCTDRVDVFCQAGQISVPRQASDLMAFLEPMVHPVRRPRAGFLFHPKVWFLCYAAEGLPDQYRLLCSTRNLGGSQAWDAVVTLNGTHSDDTVFANAPLKALISHLPELAVEPLHPSRLERLRDLAERASHVAWTAPQGVQELAFHAFGVPDASDPVNFSGRRHLVVSPFCNDQGIAHLTGRSKDVTLVSRPAELDRLPPATLQRVGRVLVLNQAASLHEPREADGAAPIAVPERDVLVEPQEDGSVTDLHAKITIVERSYGRAHLFVGSPNATSSAYAGNVEFAVELAGRARELGIDAFLGDDSPFRDLLETYAATGGAEVDPSDDALRALQNQLRALAEVRFTLTVSPDGDAHRLALASLAPVPVRDGFSVTAGLLTVPGTAHALARVEPADLTFGGVATPTVTPFLILNATDPDGNELATVVHAVLVNDPPSRLDEILARQVDTPEKFLRFLTLLLGLGNWDGPWVSHEQNAGDGAGRWGFGGGGWTGVLELVLGALADRREALADLDQLVSRLQQTESGRSVLPDGFDEFWVSVKKALDKLPRGKR